jgi:hypothetical protein
MTETGIGREQALITDGEALKMPPPGSLPALDYTYPRRHHAMH